MFCKKCGCNLSENERFCPKCGEPADPASAVQTAPQNPAPLPQKQPPAYPYTYNNVKKKNIPHTYENVQKRNSPAKKRGRLLKACIFLLIIAVAVQFFAYPFLLQRATFGKVSGVFVERIDPSKPSDGSVSESETNAIVSYAKGIGRAWAWQLGGHERKVYDIASRYLNDAPVIVGSADPYMVVSISPVIAVSSSSQSFTEEEIASDVSGIAVILQQRGYTKLAVTLNALAAEHSPVDPLIINNLSSALRAAGLNEDAYKLLGYAYKLSPDCPEILTNLGNVCLDEGDADTAATWYDMALAVDDNFGLAHEGLMLCYMNQKNYEVAMRHMIKASETAFTPAVYKTYDFLQHLDNYEDIRDNVLSGFEFSDISKTYQRTRNQAVEGVDTPAAQIKIPQFPTYTGVEAFIGGMGGMHEYAMSIFTPAMDVLNGVLDYAKQAEQMIEQFQSNGISGVIGAAQDLGLIGGQDSGSCASVNDGKLQLSMDYSRELYTIGLLGDYLDMKLKKPMDQMSENFEKSGDPLLQMAERSDRELMSRGESEEAWLGAMANNWGNSMSLNSDTISENKADINQHIDGFYKAILPTYNEIKPYLEEYWLYAGGVIKYAGDENVFKSLDYQRKIKLYGNLAIFAIHAEVEAINVPLMYEMYAVQGEPQIKQEDNAEKLEKPADEVPLPDETFSLDLGIVEAEWSNGELEVEVTALLAGSVKYNHEKGTVTLAGGVGVSSGDFVPMLGGKATATYYVVIAKNGVSDHGTATKTEYSVGEGVKYKVKHTSTISSVTSASESTVEKAIVGGKMVTYGFKRTKSE